jgi:hypothetical protein
MTASVFRKAPFQGGANHLTCFQISVANQRADFKIVRSNHYANSFGP